MRLGAAAGNWGEVVNLSDYQNLEHAHKSNFILA
jgi:hypothetical protein